MEPINFTPRSQHVLVLARQAADQMHNNYVGTEHILYGLLKLGQGIAINVLTNLGVDLDSLLEKLNAKIAESSNLDNDVKEVVSENMSFTPRAKKVLVFAANEARSLQHPYVGTEHLLLGLLRDSEGLAYKVLSECGIDIEMCRTEVLEELDPNVVTINVPGRGRDFDENSMMNLRSKASQKLTALNTFGRDLTAMAKEGSLDPVIGREKEIERTIQILCRRTKNNPALLGEAGVGKTAVVEGLAQAIADERVPEILLKKKVISLDLALMVAGTKYRGQFEERLKMVMDEVRRAKNVILFLDELHTIVGAGASEGSMDASNILKPALSRGEIQCIGATTIVEYRKNIEKDAALERRFQPIQVDPPSVEDAIKILEGIKSKYEEYHRVKYSSDVIKLAVQLSDRYISERFLPDKAIDVLDEAGASAHLVVLQKPKKLDLLSKKIEAVCSKKERAIQAQQFEDAAKFRDEECKLKTAQVEFAEKWKKSSEKKSITIEAKDIFKIISDRTGIPVSKIETKEREKLLKLPEELSHSVIGQQEATDTVSRALRRSRADLKDPNRPIGAFLFLGPTGVGKTLLAKVLAQNVFNNERSLIQVDMSEYMEKFAVSRLVGSPPGYVGHEEGGQLTEKVRRCPYSVILFDEIEKAHPDVLHILLQVLEDGRLTDSLGRVVDFKNTILIMTSNVGAELLQKNCTLGFGSNDLGDFSQAKEKILSEAKRIFKPEFLNRLSDIVVFKPLGEPELSQIIDLEFQKIADRAHKQGVEIALSHSVKEFIIKKGYDPKYGARQLRRTLEYWVEDFLAEEFLKGNFPPGSKVQITLKGENKIGYRLKECLVEKSSALDK